MTSLRNGLSTLATALVDAIQFVTTTLLVVAVAINFANIIGRYVFNAPIASAEEVMLFLLVGTVFLGNSVVAWQGKQIRMDVFLHMLPPPLRCALEVLADLAGIAVGIVLIVLGWPVIDMLAEFDQRSQVAAVPLAIPQALVPIGLGLTAFLIVARLALGEGSRQSASGEPVWKSRS
jgi:TRAP-type C4-dicarboxylate transport system permease small subunit